MPEIIITAGAATPERGDGGVTLRERVNAADFESERFTANLIERIEWAVSDAVELEHRGRITGRPMPARTSAPERTPPPEQTPQSEHPREPVWA